MPLRRPVGKGGYAMTVNTTTNYQLPLWQRGDRPDYQRLNETVSRADQALKALDDAIQAVDRQKPELVLGSYTGDGAISRVVHLGFTPRGLILASASGRMTTGNSGSDICGGVFFPQSKHATCGVVTGGFKVSSTSNSGLSTNSTDSNQSPYFYIAIR